MIALALGGLLAWATLLGALAPFMSLSGYVQTVFLAPCHYRGPYWHAVELLELSCVDPPVIAFFAAAALLAWAGPSRRFFLALAVFNARLGPRTDASL